MAHQSTPTMYPAPETIDWPTIILTILGIIAILGILIYVFFINKAPVVP